MKPVRRFGERFTGANVTWINASTAVAIGTIDSANTPTSETATIQHRVGGEGSQGCDLVQCDGALTLRPCGRVTG